MSERRLFLAAAVAAVAMRLLHTATSIGSTDAYLWSLWAGLIEHAGVLRSYRYDEFVNHPPLALAIALACSRLATATRLLFVDVFRSLQTVADLITAVALVRIAGRIGLTDARFRPAIIFLLSPAAIFISGFHCNTDPLMMMFVTLAAAAALSERPILSGALFACAVGIKIVPLFVGPLFLVVAFRDTRSRLRYLAAAAVTAGAIFLPALAVSGEVFVQRVFGYAGMVRGWGFPIVAYLFETRLGWKGASSLTAQILPAVEIVAGIALAIAAWRRGLTPDALPRLLGTALILVLVFAPSYGLQYLFWVLPFLWFAVRRPLPLLIHGAIGIYLFAVYTAWSGGWPWWYAERAAPLLISRTLPAFTMTVWAILCFAAVSAARNSFAVATPVPEEDESSG